MSNNVLGPLEAQEYIRKKIDEIIAKNDAMMIEYLKTNPVINWDLYNKNEYYRAFVIRVIAYTPAGRAFLLKIAQKPFMDRIESEKFTEIKLDGPYRDPNAPVIRAYDYQENPDNAITVASVADAKTGMAFLAGNIALAGRAIAQASRPILAAGFKGIRGAWKWVTSGGSKGAVATRVAVAAVSAYLASDAIASLISGEKSDAERLFRASVEVMRSTVKATATVAHGTAKAVTTLAKGTSSAIQIAPYILPAIAGVVLLRWISNKN